MNNVVKWQRKAPKRPAEKGPHWPSVAAGIVLIAAILAMAIAPMLAGR